MPGKTSLAGLFAVLLLAVQGGVGLESPTSVACAQEEKALPFDTACLVEGFQGIISGSNDGPYFCYRGNEVESWWEYSRDGTEMVEWESAPVPEKYAGKPVTFAVACGLGSGGGQDSYHELYVNGQKLAAFNTPHKTDASWFGVGVKLFFDYAVADKWDSFGIMYITVSPEAVEYGKPVRFKVVGTRANPRSWFMLSAIRDNVAFVMKSFDGQKMEIEYTTPTGRFVVCKEYKTLLGTFVTDIQGSDLTRLTYLCGKDVRPRFSPDGARVLFSSSEGGPVGVWTISTTGEDRKRICDGDQGEWLADGKGILFRRDGQIVERLLDTGQERIVSPPGWKSCSYPSCSPNGQRIAFIAEIKGESGIFVGAPGQRKPRCIVRSETLGAPRWSPDGNRIAYQKEAHIWVADADGSNQYQLTVAGGVQCFPAWSPRGDAVAYCQGPGTGGSWQIYVTSADSARTHAVSRGGAVSVLTPDWWAEEGEAAATAAQALRPRPLISVWDAGEALSSIPAEWESFLQERAGWKPLAAGAAGEGARLRQGFGAQAPRHGGGLVIENEQAVLLLPSREGPALLISNPATEGAESLELMLLDEGANEARQVESLRLVSSDGEEAVVEVWARSAAGGVMRTLWRLPGSRASVEVTPLKNAGKLRVGARMKLAVLPDRFGNDLLLEPQQYPQGSCFPPSAPLLLGLLEGGRSVLALVCPSDGQRAELRRDGDEAFGSADITFGNDKVVVAVLTSEGAWYQERPQTPRQERVTFGWQMPFPAMWRLAVRGKQTPYSTMFCETESAWFDTKKVFLKKGEPFAEEVELGVIYLYDRRERTPPETLTPTDIVQDALGIKGAARVLDTEGLTTYRTAAGWTTWADLSCTLQSLRHVFNRGLEVQEKVFVEHLCDDVQPFLEGMDQRLAEYETFASKIEELCAGMAGGSAAERLVESVRQTWGELHLLLQQRQGLKKPAETAEFCEKIKSLAQAKSEESQAEFNAAREGIVTVAGERQEMLRSCRALVKEIRDQAGAACLTQPEVRGLTEKIRALCREVLRMRYLVEDDWRGEAYEVPPFWLGPRAQDYGYHYRRTMTGRSTWRGGQQ